MIKIKRRKEMEEDKKRIREGFVDGVLAAGTGYILILAICMIFTIMAMNNYRQIIKQSNMVTDKMVKATYDRIAQSEEARNEKKWDRMSDRIRQLQPKLDKKLNGEITSVIFINSELYSLSSSLIIHLIFRESSFNPMALSSAGAIGLMGIVPKYHPKKCEGFKRHEFFYIWNNISIGCQILREYIDSAGSPAGGLQKYVGKSHKTYVNDIFRLMAEYEISK